MGSGADTCEVTHRNEVFLVGRVSRPPDRRQLPSGDCLVTVHVVVDRVGARRGSRGPQLDTIECVAWRAGPRRSVQTWHRGDVVEVAGALRRRFHRVDGRPVSRYQVEIGRAQRLGRATMPPEGSGGCRAGPARPEAAGPSAYRHDRMTSAPRTAQASQEVRVPVEQERVPRGRAAPAPGRRQHALADAFDVLLLDLDGVVYVGSRAVPGAADHLAHARRRGMRLSYVTNNASRPPEAIAAQLRAVGVPADPAEIVTSAQAAAREVATLVPAGSPVLVLGGAGLHQAVVAAGLRPVEDDASGPLAVVQGFSPDLTWRQLAQGTYAVRRGVPWVVSNLDRTLPTEEGLAPGNGTLVELVRSAADVPLPISVGKPARTLFDEAVRRTGARSALVVGDRLDTDIEGANAAGLPSLLVLTGVTGPAELAAAPPQLRPTYIGADMGALFRPYDKVAVHDGQVQCGGWTATVAGTGSGGRAELAGSGEWVDGLRCVVTLGWCTAGTPPIDVAAALARLGEQDRDHREDGAGAG